MIEVFCKKCGSTNLEKKNGLLVCPYCGSSFLPDKEEQKAMRSISGGASSQIDLKSDIDDLLEKCKREWKRGDMKRANRLANRILDLDPTNEEVKNYLWR